MKKAIFILTVLILVFAVNSLCLAEDSPEKAKFKRGVVNTLTGIFEVPKQIKNEVKSSPNGVPKIGGLFGGLVKGSVWAVKRTGSGLWDILSFNMERPAGFEPLMKPDYVCEKMAQELRLIPEEAK